MRSPRFAGALLLASSASCSAERGAAPPDSSHPTAGSVPPAAGMSPTSAATASTSATSSPAQPALATLIVRDQPPNEGLVRWGGKIVVRTQPPRLLDLSAGSTKPVALAGADLVEGVATWQQRPIALATKAEERFILVEEAGAIRRVELPRALRAAKTSATPQPTPLLAASDAVIALQLRDKLHAYDGARWSEVTITGIAESPATLGLLANDALLHGGTLYLGFDRGEWGGALYAVDPATGKATKQPGPDLPVRDLAVDPKGDLWAVRGLAHLGLRDGDLRVLRQGKWRIVAATDPGGPSRGWDVIAETPFDAVTFHAAGDPLLLSGSRGILRKSSGQTWQSALQGWPSDFVYLNDLEIEGSLAVIATADAGVLLVELGTSTGRRVALK